jgi:hypothetical protein
MCTATLRPYGSSVTTSEDTAARTTPAARMPLDADYSCPSYRAHGTHSDRTQVVAHSFDETEGKQHISMVREGGRGAQTGPNGPGAAAALPVFQPNRSIVAVDRLVANQFVGDQLTKENLKTIADAAFKAKDLDVRQGDYLVPLSALNGRSVANFLPGTERQLLELCAILDDAEKDAKRAVVPAAVAEVERLRQCAKEFLATPARPGADAPEGKEGEEEEEEEVVGEGGMEGGGGVGEAAELGGGVKPATPPIPLPTPSPPNLSDHSR